MKKFIFRFLIPAINLGCVIGVLSDNTCHWVPKLMAIVLGVTNVLINIKEFYEEKKENKKPSIYYRDCKWFNPDSQQYIFLKCTINPTIPCCLCDQFEKNI